MSKKLYLFRITVGAQRYLALCYFENGIGFFTAHPIPQLGILRDAFVNYFQLPKGAEVILDEDYYCT